MSKLKTIMEEENCDPDKEMEEMIEFLSKGIIEKLANYKLDSDFNAELVKEIRMEVREGFKKLIDESEEQFKSFESSMEDFAETSVEHASRIFFIGLAALILILGITIGWVLYKIAVWII